MIGKKSPITSLLKEKLLFVGLGNANPSYTNSYHNVGQLAIDYVAKHIGAEETSNGKRREFIFSKFKNGWIFIKPTTAMNDSGYPVNAACRVFGIKPDKLVVVHDDSDIALGKYKVSFGSRAAGHKGVQSIIDALGTAEFFRIRIGIRPDTEKRKALSFVLKKITSAHAKTLEAVFATLCEELV